VIEEEGDVAAERGTTYVLIAQPPLRSGFGGTFTANRRGTALVPTATSYSSRSFAVGDAEDA